jgi:hypothetical protein
MANVSHRHLAYAAIFRRVNRVISRAQSYDFCAQFELRIKSYTLSLTRAPAYALSADSILFLANCLLVEMKCRREVATTGRSFGVSQLQPQG